MYWKYPTILFAVLGAIWSSWEFLLLAFFCMLAYWLFVDSMNRAQYVERLRIYWATKDNAAKVGPAVGKGYWLQDEAPFWKGNGWYVRIGRYSFSFGRMTEKSGSLMDQLGRYMDHKPKEIREWGRPNAEEEADIVTS